MTILNLKPDALVVPNFDFAAIYPFMGLNEGGNNIMSAPVGPQWPYKGYFGMGYYLYGSNLNTSFLGGWDTGTPAGSDAAKVQAKADIQVAWANRILPWFVATPASDNTCTNAAIRIFNAQCYIKSIATGLWSRVDVGVNNVLDCSTYDTGGTSTGHGASIKVMPDNINVPAFPFCQTSTDWGAYSNDTTKYRLIHAGTTERIVISSPSDVGGIVCMFDSQVISANGVALNGTPKFMLQAGIDAGYNDDALGSGLLNGAPYSPAIAGSCWMLANTNGTRRTHYVGTFLHTDSHQDLTSYYSTHGGISVLSAAEFQNNMPHRIYQPTI